jgi:PAS domain S-box-containing protein
VRRKGLAAGLVVVALVALSVVSAVRFSNTERERTLHTWQVRLGIIADSRAREVETWLAQQFDGLAQIAGNTSLQLYLTELTARKASPGKANQDLARTDYLRNLLTVLAHRMGFSQEPVGPNVAANVRRIGIAGIALVAMDGRILVATEGMPPVEGRFEVFLAQATPGQAQMLDLHRDSTGAPALAFAQPIFAVQAEQAAANQIGWVFGVKQAGPELYPLLKQPGAVWSTTEAILVRRAAAGIDYISPTRQGDEPLTRLLSADTPRLAASFAMATPGGFGLRRDYQGNDVLVTARKISRAPWTLLYKIDRAEALGPSDDRANRLLLILLFGIAAIVAAIIAAWRHGTSVRAARAAAESDDLSRRYEAQSRFLKLITDNQPASMFVVDGENRYKFANRVAQSRAGIGEADLMGKSLASVLGPADASRYEVLNSEVRQHGERRMQIHYTGSNGDLRVTQSEHIPIEPGSDTPPGIMVVEEDITLAVAERERRERTLKHLVQTLISILDRRDPHAADHSRRVSSIARAVAEEMGLDEDDINAAETAGQLMNLGKTLIPAELLTREGDLDEGEMRLVRDSLQCGVDLLDGVEFDGPVVETLRQIQERWDGSGGPLGLVGDHILVTAQIVSVANAFVALTSARAWRGGSDEADAVGRLMDEAGSAYPRKVVSALMNLVDNRDLRATGGAALGAAASH